MGDRKRVTAQRAQIEADESFAHAFNRMCHVCEVNPSTEGFNLCQQCYTYRMNSLRTAAANAVAHAHAVANSAAQDDSDDDSDDDDDEDDDEDDDDEVPPENASYEELLAWCQRRETSSEQKLINSTVADRFPVRKCAKTRCSLGSCTICLCEYKPRESVMTLPCFHEFHESCVREWLCNKLVCPICMRDVRECDAS